MWNGVPPEQQRDSLYRQKIPDWGSGHPQKPPDAREGRTQMEGAQPHLLGRVGRWPHQEMPPSCELLCESGYGPLWPLSFSELTWDSCVANLVRSES